MNINKTVLTMQCGYDANETVVSVEDWRNELSYTHAEFDYKLTLPECRKKPTCTIFCWVGESPDYDGFVKLREYTFDCKWVIYRDYIENVFDWEIRKDLLANMMKKK